MNKIVKPDKIYFFHSSYLRNCFIIKYMWLLERKFFISKWTRIPWWLSFLPYFYIFKSPLNSTNVVIALQIFYSKCRCSFKTKIKIAQKTNFVVVEHNIFFFFCEVILFIKEKKRRRRKNVGKDDSVVVNFSSLLI